MSQCEGDTLGQNQGSGALKAISLSYKWLRAFMQVLKSAIPQSWEMQGFITDSSLDNDQEHHAEQQVLISEP